MDTKDRAVVKNLLQAMTDKYLTGSDEFRAALKHFNVTTTDHQFYEGFTKNKYVVIVFTPDRIDRCPHGFRVEFPSKEEAAAYEAKMRATGDQSVNTKVLKARETHAKTLAANIEAAHAEALEMNQARSETIRAVIAQAIHAGANTWGHVIGEHEELVDTLRNANFPVAAEKVDAVMDAIGGDTHKEIRKNWLAALRDVSAAL